MRSDHTSSTTIDDIVRNFKMYGDGRVPHGGIKFVTSCMHVALLAQTYVCMYVEITTYIGLYYEPFLVQ
jgi:hypothetical protein